MDKYKVFENQRRLIEGNGLKRKTVSKNTLHLVRELESTELDYDRISSLYVSPLGYTEENFTDQDVLANIAFLEELFDIDESNKFLQKSKVESIQSIVTATGLGRIVALRDKIGGGVDTIVNARNGIYANKIEQDAYDKLEEYDSSKIYKDEAYKAENKKISEMKKSNGVEDGYTGEVLKSSDPVDLDHVISGRSIHKDRGRVLAGISTKDIANIKENLVPTHRSINRSKGSKSPSGYSEKLESLKKDRQDNISDLRSKDSLSSSERKKLESNIQKDKVNKEKLLEKGSSATQAIDKTIENKYYASEKFLISTVESSANEGIKMGFQQSVGVLLIELTSGIFDEISDAYKNGLTGKSLIKDVVARLKRLARRLISKWRDVVSGFSGGFLSGFVSGVITTIINIFKTTARRIIRMVREGVFTLLKALKVIFLKPAGTSFREVFHEASKILACGSVVMVGIVLEDIVEKLILSIPVLAPIASILSVLVVGLISAVLMSLVLYLINKMDLFNVIKKKRDEYVLSCLGNRMEMKKNQCQALISKVDLNFI